MPITYLDGTSTPRTAEGSKAGTVGDPDVSLETIKNTLTTTVVGAPITGQSLEAGGSGILGWLASLRKAITDRLPAALGGTTATNSFPVTLSSDGTFATLTGAVTETAPASDTASSGLNGRLQRIAQRLSTIIASGIPITGVALPATAYHNQVTVTTAGTAVALASSQAITSGVTVKAKVGNASNIFVGVTGVTSGTGYVLAPGDTVFIEIANLATVFLNATTSGDGVSFIAS